MFDRLRWIFSAAIPAIAVAAALAWALPASDPQDLVTPLLGLLFGEICLALAVTREARLSDLAKAASTWLLAPGKGSARILAIASAVALFLWLAWAGQGHLLARHRHPGLLFAVYGLALLSIAALCVFLAPALARVWSAPLRAVGDPTPLAALLVVAIVAGGATAWAGLGHGPAELAPVGPVAVFVAVQMVVASLSRRRRSSTAHHR